MKSGQLDKRTKSSYRKKRKQAKRLHSRSIRREGKKLNFSQPNKYAGWED